jgi:hypothetical protein
MILLSSSTVTNPAHINELRSRISSNIGLLSALNGRPTRDNMVKLVQHQDQGRQLILKWLTPTDHAPQESDFISRRQAGTGQWLNKQALLCPGIPGAGKAIIRSIVVKYLFDKFRNSNIQEAIIYPCLVSEIGGGRKTLKAPVLGTLYYIH